MMEQLIEWDKQLLVFLNSFHHPWLDPVMMLITKTVFWIPLYLYFIFLIFKQHKKDGWWFLLGAAVTILMADQITASLMKPYFARLRPSHDPSLEGLLHLVNGYKGGLYGFASSHAANTFGAATFVWLVLGPNYRWIGFAFAWAAIMTYSRIYLGVHFPGDVFVGALVGIASGWCGYRIAFSILEKRKE